ncbi:MAG: hypothetical protein GY694_06640 [Gammaproteobacteria bacterium]|nr:hypothetical protein [Gammaproteobacteria bacterium]
MSNITNLTHFKKQQLKKKNKAHTLCRSGFHKWEIIAQEIFDTKKGKLVTSYRCKFCHKIKSTAL